MIEKLYFNYILPLDCILLNNNLSLQIYKRLNVKKNIGITLTESFAMYPTASVSGWYFSYPDSRYFGLGKINRDQVNDYAQRKNSDLKIIEKWLSPSLGYNPEDY